MAWVIVAIVLKNNYCVQASQRKVRRVKTTVGLLFATSIATLLWLRPVLMFQKECVVFPLYAKYSEIEAGFMLDEVSTETNIKDRKLQSRGGSGGEYLLLWQLSAGNSFGR